MKISIHLQLYFFFHIDVQIETNFMLDFSSKTLYEKRTCLFSYLYIFVLHSAKICWYFSFFFGGIKFRVFFFVSLSVANYNVLPYIAKNVKKYGKKMCKNYSVDVQCVALFLCARHYLFLYSKGQSTKYFVDTWIHFFNTQLSAVRVRSIV